MDRVADIAHRHNVPVIVDAATMVPPRDNLTKYIRQGADIVIISGGKGIRGPQGSGLLFGRKDLVQAAAANASPNQFIGRGMKVSKEDIVGLVTALRYFVDQDEEAQMARWRSMAQRVVDELSEVAGVSLSVVHDELDWLIPAALIELGPNWSGPSPRRDGLSPGGRRPCYLPPELLPARPPDGRRSHRLGGVGAGHTHPPY